MRFSITAKQLGVGGILGTLFLLLTPDYTLGAVVGLVPTDESLDSEPASLVQAKDDLPSFISAYATAENEISDGFVNWPFHREDTDDDSSSTTSSACADAESCEICNAFHTCHWCGHDSACHAIGSYHGCVVGSTCDSKKKKPANNETDPSGCLAHESCSACTLASHLCHWCAHDNACHAVGSVYGCVTGVDCYDNTHCKRQKPEPMTADDSSFYQKKMGVLPLLAIAAISGLVLCCATTCWCIVGGLKGAYDDLADLAEAPLLEHQHQHEAAAAVASTRVVVAEPPPSTAESRRERRSMGRSSNRRTAREEAASSAQFSEAVQGESTEVPVADDEDAVGNEEGAEASLGETQQLLEPEDEDAVSDDFVRMVNGEPDTYTSPLLSPQQQSHRRQRPRRSIHRLYNACVGCYLFTVAFVGLFAISVVRYFPQKPVYNICNDSVAWQSLIDSMTAMKATADFEILASVYNPNHFDVALDMGKGSFAHDGAFVGTYEIPSVTVAAMAVTDILIVASFAPEKWQALSITAEYYRGTLVMHVDAQASIRVPALAEYSFTASLKDLVVHVNEMSDRHLCACPTWSDANNKTKPILLPVPHWVNAN